VPKDGPTHLDLSVVIASYNSAAWLPSTLASLEVAVAAVTWAVEVLIVDDGSTDDTASVLARIAETYPLSLRVVRQDNQGRFLARWAGVNAAQSDNILLLDSRLIVGPDSLHYLAEHVRADIPWNGHVTTDHTTRLVGRFWEVPTHVFWSEYLSSPHPMLITEENFDRVPKGTGFLYISRNEFLDACRFAWPKENARLTSDDTKILRHVVSKTPIQLDPGFDAIYRPRVDLPQFLSHSFDRGTLFVDSYAGTSFARNVILVALVVAPPLAVAVAIVLAASSAWTGLIILVALVVLGLLALPSVAALRHCPARAIAAFVAFVVPFGIWFWAGLARGVVVHRRSVFGSHRRQEAHT
jgi:hypothetical protein